MLESLKRLLTHTKQNPYELEYSVVHTEGIISFFNENTTLGFIRYNNEAEVEYIFVQPMYRRKGLATRLIGLVENHLKKSLTFQGPISPLGNALIKSYIS